MLPMYILDGRTPVLEPDIFRWSRWFHAVDRTVARTEIPGGTVLTQFLGVSDHRGTQPLLFETVVMIGGQYRNRRRRATWAEAEACHADAVEKWRDLCQP